MNKKGKWDSSRSMRWNQDSQREEDQRRMNEIIGYLTKLRLNPEKMEKLKQKEVNLLVLYSAHWGCWREGSTSQNYWKKTVPIYRISEALAEENNRAIYMYFSLMVHKHLDFIA